MHTRLSLSSSPFCHKYSNTPLLITYFISSPYPQSINCVPSPLFNSCIQSCPLHWLMWLPVVLVSSPCQQQNVGRLLWSSFDHLHSPQISLVHIESCLLQCGQANVIKVWCWRIHYTTSHHTITPARLTCWLLVQHLLSTLPIHIVPTTISQSGAPPPPAHTPPYPPTVGQSLVCWCMPPQWTANLEIILDATSSSYAPCRSPVNLPAHQRDVTSQQRQLYDHQEDDPIHFSVLAGPSSNGGQPTLTRCHLHRSLPHPIYFTCDLRVPTHHRLLKKRALHECKCIV